MSFSAAERVQITEAQMRDFAALIQEASGIVIGLDKRALVQSRLQRIVHSRGERDLSQFMTKFLRTRDRQTTNSVVEALTTNHTYFWRESEQFEHFRTNCLPGLRGDLRKAKSPVVWCAASSFGQEPWTLAGLVQECAPSLGGSARILASDLSEQALAVARKGWYKKREVERLPANYRNLWFRQSGDGYTVAPMLQREVVYKKLNLISTLYPRSGSLSVIFCRNVLIYFDQPTRCKVYQRMHASLAPGGWLYISQTEAIPRGVPGWKRVAAGVFRRL